MSSLVHSRNMSTMTTNGLFSCVYYIYMYFFRCYLKEKQNLFMCNTFEIKLLPLNECAKVEQSCLHDISLNIWTVEVWIGSKKIGKNSSPPLYADIFHFICTCLEIYVQPKTIGEVCGLSKVTWTSCLRAFLFYCFVLFCSQNAAPKVGLCFATLCQIKLHLI